MGRGQGAALTNKPGAIGFILKRTGQLLLDNDEVSGPNLAVFRCSGAPGRNQRAQLRQKFGDHKELAEGGMRPVSFRCGQHDLGVRGELDTAGAATTVVQRDTSYFAIRFTGHQDFQCGGQAVVMMNELCPILCKNNFPLVVGIAQRVRTRRPGLTTVNIVQKRKEPQWSRVASSCQRVMAMLPQRL